MRERGENVLDVPYDKKMIYQAIDRQINHGPYKSEPVYGDGSAGKKIASILSKCNWKIQKTITY